MNPVASRPAGGCQFNGPPRRLRDAGLFEKADQEGFATTLIRAIAGRVRRQCLCEGVGVDVMAMQLATAKLSGSPAASVGRNVALLIVSDRPR